MNELSTLVYIANVAGNIQPFLVTLTIVCACVTVIGLIVWAVYVAECNKEDDGRIWPKWWIFACLAVLFGFAATIIPSQQTIYLIAASQAGEQILQLEEVQDLGGEAADLARVSIEALRNQLSQTLPEAPNAPE